MDYKNWEGEGGERTEKMRTQNKLSIVKGISILPKVAKGMSIFSKIT